MTIVNVLSVVCFIVFGPLIGGLLSGIDRKLSARMQGRIGPSVLQPFYDIKKLLNKQRIDIVDTSMSGLLLSYMILMIMSGAIFFSGSDILMSVFVLSTASTFLYFAAIVTSSPYNSIAASRELVQIMTYEPAVLLACVGFYLVTGTFNVGAISQTDSVLLWQLPGFFIAFVFILTIKMRKSPFDISGGHHAHQELVQGITTEMGARNLAIFHIAEWYENVFLLGFVALFALNKNLWSIPLAVVLVALVFFTEVLIDNVSARMKMKNMLRITWLVTLFAAGLNLLVLMLVH
jgi:ech hydrogenase subunit B